MTVALPLPRRRLHVIQGTHEVTDDPEVLLTTILGSCVAACIRDPSTGVGGMNHFLLPEAPDPGQGHRRYGVQAMELLINGLLALGARRHRLEAKLFGGARMSATMADIGLRNAEFARRFLADERIPLIGESLGGSKARRVQYWPAMGRAQQQLVTDPSIMARERSSSKELVVKSGEVELF